MTWWDRQPSPEAMSAAKSLTPGQVTAHLTATGWQLAEHHDRATLWTRSHSGNDFQVLVPADREVRDYPGRILDLLNTLNTVENRPIAAIVDDLTSEPGDVITFRLLPAGRSGTIPLFNATDALMGVKELVVASAYATQASRPMLTQGRRPDWAFDLARAVRLDTPKAGSWSVTARLPFAETLLREAAPPSRRLALKIHQAVHACFSASRAATTKRYDIGLFLQRTNEGISSNVCEALTRLGRDDTPYDVSFGWARQLPAAVPERSFYFASAQIAVLRTASEDLKAAIPDGPVTIEGLVSNLRREPGKPGEVTVRGPINTRYGTTERAVKAIVADSHYQRAVNAHGRQLFVRISGEYYRGHIEHVDRLEVLDSQPSNPA